MITSKSDNVKIQADADIIVIIVNDRPVILTRGEFSFLIAKPDAVTPFIKRMS